MSRPKTSSLTRAHTGERELAGNLSHRRLLFNVSHLHELAIYAVARGVDVGIDIEHINKDLEYTEIAKQYFSPREIAVLLSLPEYQQARAFYNYWTRKEAYIKALGIGLALPIDRFEVSFAPGEPPALLNNPWSDMKTSRWYLFEPHIADEYVTALAVSSRPSCIRHFFKTTTRY